MDKPVRCLSGETHSFVVLMKIMCIQIQYVFYFLKFVVALSSADFFFPVFSCDRMAHHSHHFQPQH